MSAICGVIDFDLHKNIDEDISKKMILSMGEYKIDQFVNLNTHNVFMECGLQYLTPESHYEKLPIYDARRNIYFVSDCYLDNRDELFFYLGEEKSLLDEMQKLYGEILPDGVLIYMAYLTWHESFFNHLRGAYSIVIYDANTNVATLCIDHMGNRCLYFTVNKNKLFFATTFAPIIAGIPTLKLNEKWIAACELLESPEMYMFPDLSVYDNVTQLTAGCYYKVDCNSQKKIRYWNPMKEVKRIHNKSDYKLRKIFLETYSACVNDVLRSDENTGITLSGGLDSTSVASLSVRELVKKNQKLYSFTSIPHSLYQNDKTSYYISDESEYVLSLCEMYPDIIPQFIDCNNKTLYTEIERIVHEQELPVKSSLNTVWLDEIYHQAAEKNCRLVLQGQYGNGTVSYGRILTILNYYLIRLKFKTFYDELNLYGEKQHVSRKKIVHSYFEEIRSNFQQDDIRSRVLIKREIQKKYKLMTRLHKIVNKSGSNTLACPHQIHHYMCDSLGLEQQGAYETRFGLYNGLIIRDPTKDKRMVELCMSLPLPIFAKNGVDRRLIREYMSGIVPDKILHNYQHRGRQSTDNAFRYKQQWNQIGAQYLKKIDSSILKKYIDEAILEKTKKQVNDIMGCFEEVKNENENLIMFRADILLALSVFLTQYDTNKEDN